MIYLNNELLTTERIIRYIEKNTGKLKQPKSGDVPSGLVQFQNRLRVLFFKKEDTNEAILAGINDDQRFSSYPKLKEVLQILFSLKDPSEIEGAIAQINSLKMNDWAFNPGKFNEYNSCYGYFPEKPELQHLFENLSKACRAQIVFFEQNNTEDDTMAYDYAYKLMALCINPDGSIPENLYSIIHGLMNSTQADKQHPLHELFLWKLSALPKAFDIKDRPGWHKFVTENKMRSLTFFRDAVNFEAKLSCKAPKDLDEAKKILLSLRYERANEDIAFASLCQQYYVTEERYNQCLDYIGSAWPKKEIDNIPNVTVKGTGIAENFIWVKLPVADKRGLILGDITDCCQSIGGNSEVCVKDAMSLANNGVYVLLKRKSKVEKQPIVYGQINEVDFKIIGQSYVWKSIFGNICLDSFESLNGEVPDAALQLILSDFSQQIFNRHADIHHVTLGKGGKTPQGIFDNALFAEHMRDGVDYGDSCEQYCILSRVPAENELEKLKSVFPAASENAIIHFSYHLQPYFDKLNVLMVTGAQASNNKKLAESINPPNEVFRILMFLSQMDLLTQENFEKIFSVYPNRPCIYDALEIFFKANLHIGEAKQKNFNLLMRSLSSEVVRALNILYKSKLFRTDNAQEYYDLVMAQRNPIVAAKTLVKNHQEEVALAQKKLDVIGEKGAVYRDAVLGHISPVSASCALEILVNENLFSRENTTQLTEAVIGHRDPSCVASIINLLNKNGLYSKESEQSLCHVVFNHSNRFDFRYVLQLLDSANLFEGEREQFFNAALGSVDLENFKKVITIFHTLGLLKVEGAKSIFDAFINHKDPDALQYGFKILADKDLLSGESAKAYCDAVMKHPLPDSAAIALQILSEAHLLSGESARVYCDAVMKHQEPDKAATAIQILSVAHLLAGAVNFNLDRVMSHRFPNHVAKLLTILHQRGLLNGEHAQNNIDAVFNHQSPWDLKVALERIYSSNALSEKDAQDYFDAFMRHESLQKINLVVNLFIEKGLLSSQAGKESFEAVLRHDSPNEATSALKILADANLLSGNGAHVVRDAVMTHTYPWAAASALKILHSLGLLSVLEAKTYCDAVMTHTNPEVAASALNILHSSGLFSGPMAKTYCDAVMTHTNPEVAASALMILHSSGLLSGPEAQNYCAGVLSHKDPENAASAFKTLAGSKLLNGAEARGNFEAVIRHEDPRHVAATIISLDKEGLYMGENAEANRDAVINLSCHPKNFINALKILNKADLLNGEEAKHYRDAVLSYAKDGKIVACESALKIIDSLGLLRGEVARSNFDALMAHQYLFRVGQILKILIDKDVLKKENAQATFDQVLKHSDTSALYSELKSLSSGKQEGFGQSGFRP